MSIIHSVIFGIIQGLTEFLPISSSAHLEIVGKIVPSFSDPGAVFTAIIQIGTQCAILLFFKDDIIKIIKDFFTKNDMKMGWFIIAGSIPICIIGFGLQNIIETSFRNLYITASVLIIFGIILCISDFCGKKTYSNDKLSAPKSILYGFAQGLAVIPGVSRSGGTMTAGLFMGFSRYDAAKFSFLLSIPSVFGSGFYELYKGLSDSTAHFEPVPIVIATVVSFIVGYFTVKYFMKMISNKSLFPFVVYRVLLGVILLVLLFFGVINA